MDDNEAGARQVEAVRRCQDPTPIPAEEAREMLGHFSLHLLARSPQEVSILIARVSLDQSVRLQESNERLAKWLIGLTVVLVVLTLVLAAVGIVPLLKH